MNNTIVPTHAPISLASLSLPSRIAKSAVVGRMRRIQAGRLEIIDGDEHIYFGQHTDDLPRTVTITIHQARTWGDTAFGGSIGAGEAYMAGAWSCSDLVGLCRILVRNRTAMGALEGGAAWREPFRRLAHWWHRNSKEGSRKNIAAHYDIGNELFALFLDPTLMYSSAYFPTAQATLEEAAVAKVDRLCNVLNLQPTDHLLEIGTGWGGFAIHAARTYGCRVTTTTISQRQFDLATERVHAAGLQDRITILKRDYRELNGTYDKLVSIEMIEAVGHQYYGTFFDTCSKLLKPDGLMALQCITISDQIYHQALKTVDFIQKHIFPGSCIPSLTALSRAMTKASDLRVLTIDDITPHYGRTLDLWRERFLGKLDHVRSLGYNDEFIRLWEFYLAYCAGGFYERSIGCVQMAIAKPGWRPVEQHAWA